MEEEYLILQCPACERSVKFRSDAAGTRMGCPYCKEPIDVTAADEAIPLDDEDPIEKVPLDFRRIQSTAPSTQETSDTGSVPTQKGERRKRKRQTDTPDWDEDKDSKAEKNAENHPVDDDSSEFLEMDPDSPGGVRLKRVRRKKIQTKKDKFIRWVTIASIMGAIGIAVAIAAITAGGLFNIFGKEEDARGELPGKIKILITNANKPTPDLSQDEEIIAAEVLSGFLNSKTIKERLRYVRDQKRVKPLMEAWYKKNPEEHTREWPDAEILRRKKIIDQDRYFIILAAEFLEIGKRIMALEQNKETGEMRLDWETTVGYQPISIEEFKTLRPTTPTKFWVKIKPSDFYNHGFSDPLKYQAVELSYPGREFNLVGYIDRSKKWAPVLIQMLESGAGPSLIVTLKYPQGEIDDVSQVEIDSIISDSWWQKKSEP